MKLGDIEQSAYQSDWRVVDDMSPENNALLSSDLLLSGATVHYIQAVENGQKFTLRCYDTAAIYRQFLALSRLREPVIFDDDASEIPVIFDYSESPCLKWDDSRSLANPEDGARDFFTIYLKTL